MAEVTGTGRVKRGMAEMLKGGVIMDVVNAEQAKIAEMLAQSQLWRWSAYLQISVLKAE